MTESGLKIHTCYTIDIRKQLLPNGKAAPVDDSLMSRTAEVCLHALRFCANAFLERWDLLSSLKGVLRKRQAEILIHSTVHSSAMYSDFDRKFPNMPSGMRRAIISDALDKANAFVKENHRHHDSVTGCKFAIGLYKVVDGKDVLIGTAICGRPVSRMLDDGYTLEINRLCVAEGETGNGCSMLYGASCRVAKDMGYKKVITYILESESGVSLKASNFQLEDACCGGKNWSGERKRSLGKTPEEMKQRWVKVL